MSTASGGSLVRPVSRAGRSGVGGTSSSRGEGGGGRPETSYESHVGWVAPTALLFFRGKGAGPIASRGSLLLPLGESEHESPPEAAPTTIAFPCRSRVPRRKEAESVGGTSSCRRGCVGWSQESGGIAAHGGDVFNFFVGASPKPRPIAAGSGAYNPGLCSHKFCLLCHPLWGLGFFASRSSIPPSLGALGYPFVDIRSRFGYIG